VGDDGDGSSDGAHVSDGAAGQRHLIRGRNRVACRAYLLTQLICGTL
jgi:hypothetical protein